MDAVASAPLVAAVWLPLVLVVMRSRLLLASGADGGFALVGERAPRHDDGGGQGAGEAEREPGGGGGGRVRGRRRVRQADGGGAAQLRDLDELGEVDEAVVADGVELALVGVAQRAVLELEGLG